MPVDEQRLNAFLGKAVGDLGAAISFEVADATSYNGGRYDLIAFFDCLHDLADPAGAARRARDTLATDGHVMVVEPFANDRSRTTSIRSAVSTTGRPRWCACRYRWRSRGRRLAPRPVSSGSARYS